MKRILLSSVFFVATLVANAQHIEQYTVAVKQISIPDFPGIQSATIGYTEDEALVIGGRLDGLHRRQPNVSFDSAGHNNRLYVVNFKTQKTWFFSVDAFSPELRDQLKATNHCYTQVGDTLVLVGGYGISESKKDHITFRSALRFSLREVINQVKNGAVKETAFQQVSDSLFGITGGQLEYRNGIYYLVGGHLFDGRYNPRNGPTFTQTYSSEVRQFRWNGAKPEWLRITHNEDLLHKRDYNLVQTADERYPFIAFSGVFQKEVDLPFQEATRISASGEVSQTPGFRQFYNHYECPELVILDSSTQQTHIVFLGGIAQFYDSLGVLVQDNNVPFVETISRVTIDSKGKMKEYLLPTRMPDRYGAGVSFVPSKSPQWKRKIYVWKETDADTLDMGYLLGGISTISRNVFWINEGQASSAHPVVYQLFLVKTQETHREMTYGSNPIQLHVLENPKTARMYFQFQLPEKDRVQLKVYNKRNEEIRSVSKTFKPGTIRWKQFPKYLGWYRVELFFQNHPSWNWKQWVFYDE